MPSYPRTVRVGQYDYTLKPWDQRASNNSEAYGMHDGRTKVILIEENLPPQHEAHIVLHELFHAACDTGSVRDGNANHEEFLVAVMSNQFSQIIRDNPDLMAYFEEVYRPTKKATRK